MINVSQEIGLEFGGRQKKSTAELGARESCSHPQDEASPRASPMKEEVFLHDVNC